MFPLKFLMELAIGWIWIQISTLSQSQALSKYLEEKMMKNRRSVYFHKPFQEKATFKGHKFENYFFLFFTKTLFLLKCLLCFYCTNSSLIWYLLILGFRKYIMRSQRSLNLETILTFSKIALRYPNLSYFCY